MNRTRFNVYQSSHAVAHELYLGSFKRLARGDQFTLSLVVEIEGEDSLLLDIYVDRVDSQPEDVIDGAKRVMTQASVKPNGERFTIEITFDRAVDLHDAHPEVRVSPDMLRLLQQYRDEHVAASVDAFLQSLGLE